ncbi:MAG: hypothetical protein JEZ08_23685 [Clostridiales bacterium]|nr:hypothetical protein [Clostridiales bacterium]
MKKHKKYDKDHLYDCPMCSDHALYVHDHKTVESKGCSLSGNSMSLDQALYVDDHKTVECKNCNLKGSLRGNIKKSHDKKELHVTINGVMYSVEPEKQEKSEEEEQVCVVVNNELVCVDKHSHN